MGGMQVNGIKAIIFDLDGVLLDSSPIHALAFREALAPWPVGQFRYASVAGMRTAAAMRAVLTAKGIPYTEEQIVSLAATKSSLARKWIVERNPINPYCKEVLDSLAGVYRLGMASSASKSAVDLFLSRNRLGERFACVLNGEDVRQAKPAPEIYELCASRLGLAAQQCLVIEDAVSGVQSAKSAGATVWGITATCPAGDLTRAGANRIIDCLGDLLMLAERH